MSDTDSPFVATLKKLGFEEYIRDHTRRNTYNSVTVDEEDEKSIPPSFLRLVPLEENEPVFFIFDAGVFCMTMAVDDQGKYWLKNESVDLEPYGFTPALKESAVQ